MARVDWLKSLGWSEKEFTDIKFAGFAYISKGAYKIAKTFFEALVILNPTDVYSWQTLGAINLELGDYLMALNCLERALNLNPSHVPTLINRAKTLVCLGYKQQALLQAQKIFSQTTNPSFISQAEALIQSLS